jgi:hypothetical protein
MNQVELTMAHDVLHAPGQPPDLVTPRLYASLWARLKPSTDARGCIGADTGNSYYFEDGLLMPLAEVVHV